MRRCSWRDVTVAAVMAAGVALAAPPPRPSVRWTPDPADTNKTIVEVSGLDAASLTALRKTDWQPAQWQRLLAVRVEQGDLLTDIGLPPMLGVYRVESGALRFEPRFPLEQGVQYRATFNAGALPGARDGAMVSAAFQLPTRRAAPSTIVSRVYPTAATLPENLLKFYVHFSAPMSRGHIYDHIHLRDSSGREIELPFLEIDEELWDPSMTRLTLFIDPGRIKRGVRPLEEIGPALESGKSFTLVIDRAWKDAAGAGLKDDFRKPFTVGPPDREPPDAARWKIVPPSAGTREPLTLAFPEPMDHALAQRLIHVARQAGELVQGRVELEDQERRWLFTPAGEWRRGPHQILVETTIEDLAGNNIGKPFEVDLFEGVQKRLTNATVKLSFDLR